MRRHLKFGLAFSVFALGIFVWAWSQIQGKNAAPAPFDHAVIGWIHQHRAPWLTDLSLVLAGAGSVGMMIAISLAGVAAGLRLPRLRDMAWTLPIAAVGTGAIIQTTKLAFHRARPTLFAPIMPATGYSFPSGHSLFAMSVYGLIGYFAGTLVSNRADRRLIHGATLVLIALIGVSRVYLGVHYPTDVLAGWAAGVPWLVACILIREALGRRLQISGAQAWDAGRRSASLLGKKRAKSLGSTSSRSRSGKRRTPA